MSSYSKRSIMVTLIVIALLLIIDTLWAERTPVHIRVQSSGASAVLTVDGVTYPFTWPAPPTRLALLANDPNTHEWGIDGSQSLTASIANLDPAYLRSVRATPYVAFDRWLRGEDGYTQWRNIRLAGGVGTGGANVTDARVLANGRPVSSSFVFEGDVYRIEQPVTFQFTAPTGLYQLQVDRANRWIKITNIPTAGAASTIAQWYYPSNPWPFLAINVRTLTYSAVWAALLFLLVIALGALAPVWVGARLIATMERMRRASPKLPVWTGASLVIAASLVFTLYIALDEYHGMPHIFDAQAYVFQAKILASGRLTIPPPSLIDSFPIPFFGVIRGQWVAQYAPGTALTLVPGLLLGVPWVIQPLLGGGTLALVFAIGQRLYGPSVATLAVLLGALSPFRDFMIGTYFSHPASTFFMTLAYYLLIRAEWGRRLRPTILAGFAIGMAFLCRELSAVVIGAPLTVALVLHVWRRRAVRHVALPLLAWGGGAGVFVALYGLYNWSITGSPTLSPRAISDPTDRYGFGVGYGWSGQHTLAGGLVNLDQLVTGLALDLYGWPYYMALAAPLIPFVLARANRWDLLHGVIVAGVLLSNVPYYSSGIAIGPRYVYEAIPILLLLTARGLVVLGNEAGAVLGLLRRPRWAGPLAAGIVLIALIAPDLFFYMPRQLELYHGFTAIAWAPNVEVTRIYSGAPRRAIIVTPDYFIYSDVLASLNSPAALTAPETARDDVWALASTPARYAALRAAFPHRQLFILTINGPSVAFQPWLQS